MIITILNVSPWEGPYIPLGESDGLLRPASGSNSNSSSSSGGDGGGGGSGGRRSSGSGSGAFTARDIFRDSTINVISKKELLRGEVIGSSETATVYKTTYRGSSAAMKVFREAVREMTPTQTAYLAREMKLLSGLGHPNIVGLYGVTLSDEGHLSIVTELVELGNLRTLLPHMHKDMHWVLILRMAQDVAAGMGFLHQHSVLHRNLNSSNVLVTKVLQCKVTDMGLACLSPFEVADKVCTGSVEYMAPEVLSKHAYSPKSDVYSFGAVLAELATGRPPYSDSGLSPDEIRKGVVAGRLRVLSASSSCLRPIAELITQCTAESPDARPDFDEVKARIEHIKNSLGSLQSTY